MPCVLLVVRKTERQKLKKVASPVKEYHSGNFIVARLGKHPSSQRTAPAATRARLASGAPLD
jgi:hypothetical protein